MLSKTLALTLAGVFLIIDQWLKWQALRNWLAPVAFMPHLEWHPFLNPGVAFGLPVPSWLALILTVPILAGILLYLHRRFLTLRFGSVLGLVYIAAGALSNFADRLRFGHTVDYIRIFTSVINLGDVMIVAGFLVYLISLKVSKVT